MLQQNQYENNVRSSPSLIQEYVPLADKNTFRTGGTARFYAEPKSILEFQQALQFAHHQKLELFILGGGANILVHDDGFNGLVIKPMLTNVTFAPCITYQEKTTVTAGAGVSIDQLIQICFDHNRIGLEEFSGIPGNIGGAVFINLHYYEFLLEHFLLTARIIHRNTGEILHVDTAWFEFGYDQSKLQNHEYFVLDATFQVTYVDDLTIAYARGRSQEIIRHRRKRYPYENTCGSFFRNFHPQEVINTDKKLIFIAYYLDQLGVKGTLSVGGAIVSHQHANMIVNHKQGTSNDIVKLAQTMQKMVFNRYQIWPEPECQLLGFTTNPFLKAVE